MVDAGMEQFKKDMIAAGMGQFIVLHAPVTGRGRCI